jgi:DNA-binding NarL/FixJ family response regulator
MASSTIYQAASGDTKRMESWKLLIVDDHPLFREGVRITVAAQPDMKVVGEANDAVEALQMARKLKPDLILLDISMSHCNGLDALRALKRELPQARVVILTVHGEDENLFEAIKHGAQGFLHKNIRGSALVDSLRAVMRGEAAITPGMTGKFLKEIARLAREKRELWDVTPHLTPREREVLDHLVERKSNREIAAALHISEHTVKSHVSRILIKLGLRNRAQAAEYAYRTGLVR